MTSRRSFIASVCDSRFKLHAFTLTLAYPHLRQRECASLQGSSMHAAAAQQALGSNEAVFVCAALRQSTFEKHRWMYELSWLELIQAGSCCVFFFRFPLCAYSRGLFSF